VVPDGGRGDPDPDADAAGAAKAEHPVSTFQVWAPVARRVDLVIEDGRIAMAAGEAGWWSVEVPGAGPGAEYRFSVDGKAPLPDPRSSWQPGGVHGPSRVVDHAAFPWSDQRWQPPPLSAAVIYELHVGTFTPEGTFASAVERLGHLAALGATHVELMPVAEFSGARGWGYDGVDLFAPHHAYGGPEGLKRLVNACHGHGLAVLLDVVYNHLGPVGNYLGRFGPYFTDRYSTPWGEAVNFDGRGSDEVRRFVFDNARAWLEDYHVDGLRIDAVHAIFDHSARHVLEELASEVRALEGHLGRRLVLIAESDLNDPGITRMPGLGGYGLDAQWNEDFHHALHAVLTGERSGYYADFGALQDLATALREGFVYAGRYSRYRGRRHGRPATGLGGHAFVGCLQNHDQIGNRARGDRTSHLLGPGRLKIGAALVLTAPFVPMLFQGEEWGASTPFQYFTDHDDLETGRAVSEGRRREFAAFGWDPEQIPDPQAAATFDRSKLDWGEPCLARHADLLDWHCRLIRLRREQRDLSDGRLDRVRTTFDEHARWFLMERGAVTVACNLADEPRRLPLGRGRPRDVLVSSDAGVRVGSRTLDMPPDSVVILGSRDASTNEEGSPPCPGST
jgi:maltooligosyltrehalose trehalohydrolase